MKLLALFLFAAAAAGVSFREVVLPAGAGASFLAAADLNGDGRPDLVVANPEAGEVTILLNDGGGRFHAAEGSPFRCGPSPNDFAVADFNHDGHADLAVVNTQTPFIRIFLGDGRGGFREAPGSPIRTASYPHPHGVAAGDFTGRGAIDLITDSWGHNQIEMLTGDGRGGFREAPGSPIRTASYPHPHGVAAGDFTGRGVIDLITDSWGHNQIEMLTGDGRGGFANGAFFEVGKRPYQRLRSADLNGDGKADIVTTNLDGDSATILLGDGRGGFHEAPGSPVKTAPAPWAVEIADVNRDGKLDLAIIPYDRDAKTRGGTANVTVLVGDGSGRFTPLAGSPFSLGDCAQPTGLAAADLTHGRWLDIAVTCVNNSRLALLTPDAGGYRLSLRSMPGQPYGVVAADFFGTGKTALAVSNSASGTVTLMQVQ